MNSSIKLIDDLKHQLKNRDLKDPIANELDFALNRIINIFVLDQDPHVFASEPIDLPAKIKAYPSSVDCAGIKQWYQDLLEWIPYKLIRHSDLISRCLNNLDCELWDVSESDVKSAILSLKEDGLIEFDHDWELWIKRV